VEYLQNTWTFPTEFPLAEISMIVSNGVLSRKALLSVVASFCCSS